MSGKIVLNLAISLDGYIADEDGGFDWIAGHGDDRLDTEQDYPFPDFLKTVDVAVMGRKSYDQGIDSYVGDYADKKVYVATHESRENEGNVTFLSGDIVDTILMERDAGKTVYLFGGGVVIAPFVKADVVDEYIIGIIPVILGGGRPLFLGGSGSIPLRLEKHNIRDGITTLYYSKR